MCLDVSACPTHESFTMSSDNHKIPDGWLNTPITRALFCSQEQEEDTNALPLASQLQSEEKDTNPQLKQQEKMLHIRETTARAANTGFISRLIMNGFKPRWYVVFHLNNYRYSPESIEFEGDLKHIKNIIYRIPYGKNWWKMPTRGEGSRARCVWSTEFGAKKDRPHINLLLEDFVYPFNTQQSLEVFYNYTICPYCKSVWKKSAHIQPIYWDTKDKLIDYICKESNFRNTTINPHLTDF